MSAFNKTLLASLLVPCAMGVQTASADLITEWGYDVDSHFENWTATGGAGEITASDGNSTLSWGVGDGPQSSISITPDVSAPSGLVTGGAYVAGGTFTHTNNILPARGLALDTFDLVSSLTLTPYLPSSGASLPATSRTFQSFFVETGNSGSGCCDDIFTVGNIDALNAMATDNGFEFASPSFTIEDYAYTVFLELDGLAFLTDNQCTAAGATAGCVGLVTEENAINQFNTRFRIVASEVEVPEPGTLALLGMGLAGLGLARRKKQ